MLLGSLTVTYSLKVKVTFVPLTGTLVVPGFGETLTTTGGIVSLNPPVGAWVVFAQEWENMEEMITTAAGIRGRNLVRDLFIML